MGELLKGVLFLLTSLLHHVQIFLQLTLIKAFLLLVVTQSLLLLITDMIAPQYARADMVKVNSVNMCVRVCACMCVILGVHKCCKVLVAL